MPAYDVLDRLAATAHAEGGWGYQPGQPAHLEPTCLALVALAADRSKYAAAIETGKRALQAHARADGSYRLARGRPQAAWPTALVLFALSFVGLGWLGLQPAEGTYVMAARLLAVIYFGFFLLMPYYTSIDKTKPLPDRVVYHA